jgi:transcriptional regulator with XRE-family HTH domain
MRGSGRAGMPGGCRFDQESENYMSNAIERSEFSMRLRETLRRASCSESATHLAREFNSRFAGDPVSVHAARKWLMGEAIPTQEKLRLLSQWFGVSAEWLRFGTGECRIRLRRRELTARHGAVEHDAASLDEFRHLSESGRRIVCEVIRLLAHAHDTD